MKNKYNLSNRDNRTYSYLKRHKRQGLTSNEAIKLFGDTRIADSICNLRKKGFQIITKRELVFNRYNEPRYIGRYFLILEPKERVKQ